MTHAADAREKEFCSPRSGLYVDFRPRGSPPAEHQRRSIAGTGVPSKRADPAWRRAARRSSCRRVHRQSRSGSALQSSSARRQRARMGGCNRARRWHHLETVNRRVEIGAIIRRASSIHKGLTRTLALKLKSPAGEIFEMLHPWAEIITEECSCVQRITRAFDSLWLFLCHPRKRVVAVVAGESVFYWLSRNCTV